ncbi:MAG: ABC-F family ATP-binding cassette domain-containing protein [Actinobacteria bacterium]|nr:ABC-F family ATP-binding cassette domain-containing protein [Actinomycetota bacterium]
MLAATDLRIEAGGVTLLDGVTFSVRARDKVGLVGRNGAGKTTLLRVLGGAGQPAAGSVKVAGGLGYLPQDPRLDGAPDDLSALRHVLSGRGIDEAVDRLEKLRLRIEEDPSERNVARYSRAEERFRLEGGYAAEADVRRIAAGLGVGDDRLELALGALSGGERRRVEIVRILFAGSDVLLLDEPTNHLDTDAKGWLLGFLRSYRGALVVISHDLDLLDEAITRVLHLDRRGDTDVGTMVEYKGTYSQYVAQRHRDEERAAKMAATQAREINRLQTVVDRFGAKATKASMAHSIEKRIARLERDRVHGPAGGRDLAVRFPDPPRAGRTALEVSGLAKSYGSLHVFDDVSFDLGRGDRLLVLGFNGAGKTSLLRILAGTSTPDRGEVRFGFNVTAGYYAQEHEGIVAGRTLFDHVRESAPELAETQQRALLGMFGLTGDKVFQDASSLSGGEKTKLALCQLVGGRHNLLLLDEPTNNLDPGSREAIARSLAEWPGALVLVSHDTDFVRALRPDRALLMPDGTLDHWNDDLLDLVALA